MHEGSLGDLVESFDASGEGSPRIVESAAQALFDFEIDGLSETYGWLRREAAPEDEDVAGSDVVGSDVEEEIDGRSRGSRDPGHGVGDLEAALVGALDSDSERSEEDPEEREVSARLALEAVQRASAAEQHRTLPRPWRVDEEAFSRLRSAEAGALATAALDSECSICCETATHDAVVLPCGDTGCPSIFHASCIRPWIERNPTCPLCRSKLEHLVAPATAGEGDVLDCPVSDVLLRFAVGSNTTIDLLSHGGLGSLLADFGALHDDEWYPESWGSASPDSTQRSSARGFSAEAEHTDAAADSARSDVSDAGGTSYFTLAPGAALLRGASASRPGAQPRPASSGSGTSGGARRRLSELGAEALRSPPRLAAPADAGRVARTSRGHGAFANPRPGRPQPLASNPSAPVLGLRRVLGQSALRALGLTPSSP